MLEERLIPLFEQLEVSFVFSPQRPERRRLIAASLGDLLAKHRAKETL